MLYTAQSFTVETGIGNAVATAQVVIAMAPSTIQGTPCVDGGVIAHGNSFAITAGAPTANRWRIVILCEVS